MRQEVLKGGVSAKPEVPGSGTRFSPDWLCHRIDAWFATLLYSNTLRLKLCVWEHTLALGCAIARGIK